MASANLKLYLWWTFALLCLYVVGNVLFWGNNRTQTTRPTTSSSSGVSSLFVSQSRSVWNEYIESSRTSYVYATKRNVKSFRPGLSILIIKDFLIIGGVHGTDWQNVCAECGQGDVAIQNNMTWNMPAIVVFSGCSDNDEFFITLYNIYAYYDRIIQCSMQLRVTFPQSVLVWANPKDHLDGRFNNGSVNNNADLRKLHAHLVLEHLINRRGLLVMPPPTGDLTTPSEARTWLANVQNQVYDITQRISKELIRSVDGGSTANTNTSFNMLAEYQRDASKIAQQEIRSLHGVCAKYTTTRRYHPLCHPADALAFPLLITGLGGAGTHFVAQRLRSVGWRVLHEDIDVDGSVSWFYGANDRAVGLRYPYGALTGRKSSILYPRFGHVIHLVRNPAHQISSFTAHSNKTYNFVLRTMHFLHNVSSLLGMGGSSAGYTVDSMVLQAFQQARAAQHSCLRGGSCHLHFAALSWLHWNRFVHSFADVTFRVGQVEELVQHVCRLELNRTVQTQIIGIDAERFCKIEECPTADDALATSKNFLEDLQQRAFHVLDQVFGVCKINDALFQRSGAHKRHLQYNLTDIAQIDNALAEEIRRDAEAYGFNV